MKFSTHYDLFAGIGGFSLALEGEVERTIHVEIDKDCQKVLAKAFPDHQIIGDIKQFNPLQPDKNSIITGGAPCQSFSRNGKGYNLNNRTVVKSDDRANLFLEVVRLLQNIQPQLFIVENVKELLTIKSPEGEPMIDIITDAFKGCGYSVNIEVLCPTDFGIPQQRKRVFILGTRHDSNLFFAPPSPIISPPNSKVLDLLEENVDPSFLLKNLWKNRTLNKNKEKTRLEALIESYNSRKSEGAFNDPTGKIQPVAIIYGDTPSGLPRQQDKLYSCWGVCPTLATFSTPAFDHHNGWRTLTPKECLRLQSFPDTHPISDKKAAAYKQTGNAVNVKVVNSIIKRISEKTPSESN